MRRARPPRVLVIDDQPKAAEILVRRAPDLELVTAPSGRTHATSWSEAEPLLRGRGAPDVVVLDLRFEIADEELLPERRALGDGAEGRRERRERRDRQGLLILERLRRLLPDLPVVLTTAHDEIPFEDEARRLFADAFTYTAGEEELTGEGLVRLVRRVLAERDAPLSTGRFLWGRSPAMRELRRRVAALAPTPLPLLVSGPTGTGKNLLVREVIHPLSGRRGPLVAFDCATVPEALLPAALFGSVRGSYTGSVADRPGVFEAAGGGTLFLDEVENLSGDAQKSLLTALNDGVVRRLGATSETPHTARIVAAANSDLKAKAAAGEFRSDLLMRLNPALALRLPPLVERREDLADLTAAVTARFGADPGHRREIARHARAAGGPDLPAGAGVSLVPDEDVASAPEDVAVLFVLPRKGWAAIVRHSWPGNLRQLEMTLTDLLAAAVYSGAGVTLDRKGRALFLLDARLLFDLLAGAESGTAPREERLVVARPRSETVEGFRRELERTVYRTLFRDCEGDFARMAEQVTGSRRDERAVRLRFNRLGLSARRER